MKITILVVGKSKHSFVKDGEAYYMNMLKTFAELQRIEISEEKMTPSLSEKELLAREGKKILAQIPKDAFCAVLSPKGK